MSAIESPATNQHLLTIPDSAGRAIVEAGAVVACPLLNTDQFIAYCNKRSLPISRERLIRFERLGLFAPFFRVRTPSEDTSHFTIPLREGNNWFDKGWAWDTTRDAAYTVPNESDQDQQGYYSIFQIDHLAVVLNAMTLEIHMDSFLESRSREFDWKAKGANWLQSSGAAAELIRRHEYRRSKALLCQFISDRYYPQTQGDQRTIQISQGSYSDRWISIFARDWDWHWLARHWDPHVVERLFNLTPEKLRHAYRGLATSQAYYDPLENWYQLTQFISVHERSKLKR